MVINLNDLLESALIARDMRSTESLNKTIWEKCVSWRDGFAGKGWGFIWICDVHEDYVEVYDTHIASQDYPRYSTKIFRAADPNFLEKVFHAIDKAIVRKP